jgi:alpha-tubulin suppressor-like RCC1 family protein
MSRNSIPYRIVLLAALITAACEQEPAGPLSDQPAHIVVAAPNGFTQLTLGLVHSCALRTDGVVECWGVTGNIVDEGQAPASKSASAGSFTQVSSHYHHTCALRDDGVVECWGNNNPGQAPPTRAAATGQFTAVSAGRFHSCALRSDGVIECWGLTGPWSSFDYGQAPATRSAGSGAFIQISAGTAHTCGLRSDGVIECFGYNGNGMAPPLKTAASGAFSQVAAGQDHTCALRLDGVVECWGYDGNGQAPAVRPAASGVFAQISAGAGHTCGRRNDGAVECWGAELAADAHGQAPAIRNAGTGSFSSVSAGGLHTCAARNDGVVECWGYNENSQAPTSRVASGVYDLHLLPTASFSATPATVVLGQSFTLALANAQVPGYAGPVTFTYAFDCSDGTGYSGYGASDAASCAASQVGNRTVQGKVRDQDGDQTEYVASVAVIYAFSGFIGSIDAPPTFNTVKAGSAVPAKFNLGGDQGLVILAAGYPKSQPVQCDASSPADPIEETVSAGASSLSYDASTGQYTYVWKTEKAWANTCRVLTLRLVDGSEYTALFKFSR